MRKGLTFSVYLCFAASVPVIAAERDDAPAADTKQQTTATKPAADKDAKAKKTSEGTTATRKTTSTAKTAKKKPVRASAAKKKAAKDAGLGMEPAIVCKTIDGYEDYEPLPGAAQTSEEKLLIYFRPTGFRSEKVEKGYQAHLTADGEVRKHGEKAILRQKKKVIEYEPVTPTPPQFVFLKQSVSLKGFAPGDYDLTIILHDELADRATATQIVRFKVIPNMDPRKAEKEPAGPHELDTLYLPFLDVDVPDPDDE